jgi:hypothetical protein
MTLASTVTAIAVGSLLAGGFSPVDSVPTAAAHDRVAVAEPAARANTSMNTPERSAGAVKTTVAITPSGGPAYQYVTMTVTVSSASGAPDGSVMIRDGGSLLATVAAGDQGLASVTTNALGPGPHSITAAFAGHAGCSPSVSSAVRAEFDTAGATDGQAVVLTIPVGALTITTPHTVSRPLDLGRAELDLATSTYSASAKISDIVITDTRAGNLGFTTTVVASRFVDAGGDSFAGSRAGFVGLVAHQVPGNALRAADVRLVETMPVAPGLGAPRVFARYPAGLSTGTVRVDGVLAVAQVPSSVSAGRYVARLTFTAL